MMRALVLLFAVMLLALVACEDDEYDPQRVVNACLNVAALCEARNPEPWPLACVQLPTLPCRLFDDYDGDWPCPCVGDPLERVPPPPHGQPMIERMKF